VNFCRTELPAPDVTRRFLIARWVNLGSTASISGLIVDRVTHYVMVTNDEGEIADARSLCPRIHCRLPEASVCKPCSSVHALFVGSILDPLVLTKSWRKAADSVGVDARLHDVRHFHISNLLRNGVPINAVQVRAGHSSPMVTLSIYGHVIPGEDEFAASVFARVMAGSEKS